MRSLNWPGASFWREISAANPDALVLLSTRDPEAWYQSASNTIFNAFENGPPGLHEWFATVREMLAERFSDDLENPTAMMDAFEHHNAEVRTSVPAGRLLVDRPGRLGARSASGWAWMSRRSRSRSTNTTNDTRGVLGLPPLPQAG